MPWGKGQSSLGILRHYAFCICMLHIGQMQGQTAEARGLKDRKQRWMVYVNLWEGGSEIPHHQLQVRGTTNSHCVPGLCRGHARGFLHFRYSESQDNLSCPDTFYCSFRPIYGDANNWLSYRRETARRLKSVEILSAAAQLYEISHLTTRIAFSCDIKISPVGSLD